MRNNTACTSDDSHDERDCYIATTELRAAKILQEVANGSEVIKKDRSMKITAAWT